jgi:hypothetical protein
MPARMPINWSRCVIRWKCHPFTFYFSRSSLLILTRLDPGGSFTSMWAGWVGTLWLRCEPAPLWGSRSRTDVVTCGDRRSAAAGMIMDVSLRLLYLIFDRAPRLADAARRRIVVPRRGGVRPAPRSRGTPQNQPEPLTWTGPTAQVRRADPTPPRTTARSPPSHPGHGLALAPPPGDQQTDLPEPLRSPTPRRHHHRADRTAGRREPDPGLPAHPR